MKLNRPTQILIGIVALVAVCGVSYRLGLRTGVRKEVKQSALALRQADEKVAAATNALANIVTSSDKTLADLKSHVLSANDAKERADTEVKTIAEKLDKFEQQAREAQDLRRAEAQTPYVSSDKETLDATTSVDSLGGLLTPKRFYLVAAEHISIYWRDIILARDPETFVTSLQCTCNFASAERRRVVLSPSAGEAGKYELVLTISNLKGEEVSKKTIELIVSPSDAGSQQSMQMLLIGDSLGHQSRFPNQLAALLAQPGNPKITFVGTHKPAGSNIYHEQYGGWQFVYFTTLFGEDPKSYHRERSPFVFEKVGDKPVYDFKRYLDQSLKGARPHFVHIQLGINDGFSLSPDALGIDDDLSKILDHADELISGIRSALPDAVITVGSVIQANASDRAFIESYRPYPQFHSEWRWRQVQMRLARKMIDHFEDTQPGIFLVPTHMTVDALDGYTPHIWVPSQVDYRLSNAVHPSDIGDKQLTSAIYGVMKASLAGTLISR